MTTVPIGLEKRHDATCSRWETPLIHGYHLIFGTYGFWLPNDPRGSWSDFVHSWELSQFGAATKSFERHDVDLEQWANWQSAAQQALRYPPVVLSGIQARAAGTGFGNGVRKSGFTIWACSILPEHVHLVVARHTYSIERVANLLKGEATKCLKQESLHPQARHADARGKIPSLWAGGQWKVFLDSEEAIVTGIRYVEENPVKEGKPPQKWSIVTPFAGIGGGGWTTYH